MQLTDLVKPISAMSDEELLDRVRELRHRRDVVRPAKQKHVERAASKGKVSRINKAADLFSGMSEADREALIKALEG